MSESRHMTRREDRPRPALPVIGAHTGLLAGAQARETVLVEHRGLIERARAEGAPVVWFSTRTPSWSRTPTCSGSQTARGRTAATVAAADVDSAAAWRSSQPPSAMTCEPVR